MILLEKRYQYDEINDRISQKTKVYLGNIFLFKVLIGIDLKTN